MKNPLLSIVIANYNYGRFLEEAIQSVLLQSCQDFELIICDGGSTDSSVEIIKKYESQLAWWCSEPDKGQSDAFNKGFAHARGKYLTWLNADDVMLPGVIEKLEKASKEYPKCEWFIGGSFWLDPEMRIVKCNVARPFSEIRYRSGIVNVCGPSSFFSRELLEAVGGVDVRFKYMMDSDLWMKFSNRGVRYRVAIKYAYGLRLHPEAKMSGHNFKDGKLDFSAYDYIADPKHLQLEKERTWMCEGMLIRPFNKFLRLCSVSWIPAIQGVLDTIKDKGLNYKDFKKGRR